MKGPQTQASTDTGKEYDPVECPTGPPKNQCEAMNVWGEAWRVWGEEVRAALRNLGGGGPNTVSPPPKPPFKP